MLPPWACTAAVAVQSVRFDALLARNAKRSRVQFGHRWQRERRQRAALRALETYAMHNVRRTRRVARFGRVLARVSRYNLLQAWVAFVKFDTAALALATEVHPAARRRACLRRWRAITAACMRCLLVGSQALVRWTQRAVSRAFLTWSADVMRTERRWRTYEKLAALVRHRKEGRALRSWGGWLQQTIAALGALKRSWYRWDRRRVGLGLRRWIAVFDELRARRCTQRAVLARLGQLGCVRAMARWRDAAAERRSLVRIAARWHPTLRTLQGALRRWAVACTERERVARAAVRSMRHRGARLLMRTLDGWLEALACLQAERAERSRLGAARLRCVRGLRTWRAITAVRMRLGQVASILLPCRLRRSELRSLFRAFARAAAANRRKAVAVRSWRRTSRHVAMTAWALTASTRSRAMALTLRAARYLFDACVPATFDGWASVADASRRRRFLGRRALRFWSAHDLVAAVRRWEDYAATATATRVWGCATARKRHALERFRRARLTAHSLRRAVCDVRAARRSRALRTWRGAASHLDEQLELLARAGRTWRAMALGGAIAAFARRQVLWQSCLALWQCADERRTRQALRRWHSRSMHSALSAALLRRALGRFRHGGAARAMSSWAAFVSRTATLRGCMHRWQARQAAGAFNSWVALAVHRASLRFSIASGLASAASHCVRGALRTWCTAAADAGAAQSLLADAAIFWSRAFLVETWLRWGHAAAERRGRASARQRRARRLLAAGFATWQVMAEEAAAAAAERRSRPASVVVFGAGALGQLGHGCSNDILWPTRLPDLGKLRVRAAACGAHHTALLSMQGEVYSFGVGEYGALGHGSEHSLSRPRRIESLVGEHAVGVACGWRHTVCVTASGLLYSWGHGRFGQLGHGGLIDFFLPLQLRSAGRAADEAAEEEGAANDAGEDGEGAIESVDGTARVPSGAVEAKRRHMQRAADAERGGAGGGGGVTWQHASCGWRHSAALTAGGVLYTWGDGEHWQLGHGSRECRREPQVVTTLAHTPMRQIECGSHHCAALTTAGGVYTWGAGGYGQLGHGESQAESVPRLVAGLAAIEVVRVACGRHTCVLGSQGDLYTFGNGRYGQLGHGEQRPEVAPQRVNALRHARVVGVACGEFHSLALTDEGHVYSWGAGAFGELGHGDRSHRSEPTRIEALQRHQLCARTADKRVPRCAASVAPPLPFVPSACRSCVPFPPTCVSLPPLAATGRLRAAAAHTTCCCSHHRRTSLHTQSTTAGAAAIAAEGSPPPTRTPTRATAERWPGRGGAPLHAYSCT